MSILIKFVVKQLWPFLLINSLYTGYFMLRKYQQKNNRSIFKARKYFYWMILHSVSNQHFQAIKRSY